MARFLETERGGRKLVYDGYAYVKEAVNTLKTHWKCEKKRICQARVHTILNPMPGADVEIRSEHTHPADPTLYESHFYKVEKQMESSSSACPICAKEFSHSTIEKHVEKCLFLNSSSSPSTSSNTPKRKLFTENPPEENLEPKNKKNKLNNNGEVNKSTHVPLAEKLRPTSFSNFFGHQDIVGEGKLLRNLFDKCNIPNMILWGPPGCGKTTIANIISNLCQKSDNLRFVKLSATMSGVNDVKDTVKTAKTQLDLLKRKTVLFMDEIHRFNKLQQDIFLPHVESGLLTLIGATTENPSFSLNSALLSRCRTIVLEKLSSEILYKILSRALVDLNVEIIDQPTDTNLKSKCIEKAAVQWLADICDGDARISLNTLEIAVQNEKSNVILLNNIKDSLTKTHLLYDKKGEEHYNLISALHKSIRASNDNAALYWLTRILLGGEDPLFVARRLVRAASEDIGLADPQALSLAVSTMQGCQLIGMPECDVLLAQCAVYLARAPKTREMDSAINNCKNFVKNFKGPQPTVPLHLRNAPTKLMKDLGYGKGYSMTSQTMVCMPPGLEDVNFFDN